MAVMVNGLSNILNVKVCKVVNVPSLCLTTMIRIRGEHNSRT